ncbi:MAG: DUF4838 domain-containing protein [Verrucomicrobia bacterium]|nr:DUF4838 domain-containing protein [Verrucomicrobiota bacterium]
MRTSDQLSVISEQSSVGKGRCLLPLALLVGAVLCASCGDPSFRIAQNGQSQYRIYFETNAPSSIKLAAQELQRGIEIAAGVKLPIVHGPARPMIALGDTAASRAAGISLKGLPDDAFVIQSREQNLFIAGKDDPDAKITSQPGGAAGDIRVSHGTLIGTYAFLEKFLDVRWLLPGEWGEDIPKRAKLRIPRINLTESPAFPKRILAYVQESAGGRKGRPEVNEWIRRQKLGGTLLTSAGHAWDEYISKETLKKHPEYLAVDGDKDKYCTSKEAVVREFAQGVIHWIEKHPEMPFACISPTDGGGFCKCPTCLSFVEKNPHGDPSYSYLILKFYNDIAKIVGAKYPDKLLCGLVYYNYMYPPQRAISMEPNVALEWAALEYYGFGLYKPKHLAEFKDVARAWSVLTKHFSLTSYTMWMRSQSGAPIPPSIELLKLEIPTIKSVGAKGVYLVGLNAWGYGAPLNYLFARQAWDANIDVEKTYREWLERAYGPGWRTMQELFALLDSALKEHKRKETKRNYDVTYDVIVDVYLPRFEQIKRLYGEALRQAQTEPQRRRLQMFGDNLVQLHDNLRRAGLLKNPAQSVFHCSDGERGQELALALTADPKAIWAPEQRKLVIPRLPAGTAAPILDGDLSDAAWAKVAVADEFRLAGMRVSASRVTTARLIYDDANLYIAFRCAELKSDEIKANRWPRDDGKIYHDDDLIEVFFSETNDPSHWWHLTVNPAGAQWDGLNDKVAYNLDWSCATKADGNAWTVEIQIPFASLGAPAPSVSTVWRANLAREEQPSKENSTWNGVEERFAEPNHFGEWKFGK